MSSTAAPALEVEDVHVALRRKPVLHGLSLSLAEGECRAVVGLNGAGKTTTLRVILGMLRPDAGRVLLHGRDIASCPRDAWRRVGHLVETPLSYPELTARQNILATARLDEPTNGLDPLAVVGFRALLREVTRRGGSVLVTGHHFDELTRIADRVDILHRGRVIDTITPGEPGRPGGLDLERVFFDIVLAADRDALEPGSGRSSDVDWTQEGREAS